MQFTTNCIGCIFKATKSIKHGYSLVVYNQSLMPDLIEYIKSISGTGSLVDAISSIQMRYQFSEHCKIQFISCSYKNFDRYHLKKR